MLNSLAITAMRDELWKTAGKGEVARKFWEGAKHELGPALGATLGAGAAKVVGVDPLAGAGLGYGLGSVPDIAHALRNRPAT